MENILFICTGNTCRSFMAEEIFNDIIDKENLKGKYSASSAGIGVYMDCPPTENALTALKNMGITPKEHISRQVNEDMIKNADVVLTMGRTHKEFLEKRFPMYADKFYTLSEYEMGIDSLQAEENLVNADKDEIEKLKEELSELTAKREELLRDIKEIEEKINTAEDKINALRSKSKNNKSYEDIKDPYGLSVEVYEKTAEEIKEKINKIINFVAYKEDEK